MTELFRDDSFIWLASETKIVTATAVLMAAEKRLIRLEDLASTYIPELAHPDILCGFEDTPDSKSKNRTTGSINLT